MINKILVTGTSGLIGYNLSQRLLNDGYEVYGVIHTNNKRIKGVEYLYGDLQDMDFCKEVTEKMDVVINCAANTTNAVDTVKSPLVHVTPNVIVNTSLIEAAYFNKVKKYIFISSSTVYPPSNEKSVDETWNIFEEPYPVYHAVGWMKRYGEVLCDLYANHLSPSMDCLVIRPANCYGPHDKFDLDKCHVTPATIRKVVDRHFPIEVWGDGLDVRDVIYIDDFVDGLITVMEQCKEKYEVVNIGTNESYTINEILEKCLEIEMDKKIYEYPVKFIQGKPSMIPIRKINSDKIKEKYGWERKHTLEEGLRKTIDWYKEQ
jgi:GDP-L-fucose synthase